jgi:chitodextrinase
MYLVRSTPSKRGGTTMSGRHPSWVAARVAALALVLTLVLGASPALAARDRTPPTTPTNLHVTATTENSVTLVWDASTDNSGNFSYRIHLVSPSMDKVANQTSLTWTSLSPTTTYSFYVYAVDKAGNRSANSNTVTVTTQAPNTAPTTPTNLHTTAVAHTTATLAWNPSTDNSGSVTYRIQMESIYSSSAMETSQTSITWTSLSPNTTYSFYVYAFDQTGNRSANSNTLTVTTLADTTPPTAPELSGSVLGSSQVSLSWTAATDENQWWSLPYQVFVNGSPAAHVNWDAERRVHIRHLTPATTYVFTVQAYDTSNNRSTSNQVTLTTQPSSDTVPPTAPTNLHLVSDQGGGEFYIGWTQSTDDVDPQYAIEYEIYVNGVMSSLPVSAGVDQDFVYARPECVNTVVVKAVDRTGNTSGPSNELTHFPWGVCP